MNAIAIVGSSQTVDLSDSFVSRSDERGSLSPAVLEVADAIYAKLVNAMQTNLCSDSVFLSVSYGPWPHAEKPQNLLVLDAVPVEVARAAEDAVVASFKTQGMEAFLIGERNDTYCQFRAGLPFYELP